MIETALENVVDDAEKTTHWHRDQNYRVPAEGCTDSDCQPLMLRFDQIDSEQIKLVLLEKHLEDAVHGVHPSNSSKMIKESEQFSKKGSKMKKQDTDIEKNDSRQNDTRKPSMRFYTYVFVMIMLMLCFIVIVLFKQGVFSDLISLPKVSHELPPGIPGYRLPGL